jgi:5-enolpyruvylshikimate-3-phosphate synthase
VKNSEKIQNVVSLLSSLGVNIKKTKSRLDIINTPNDDNKLTTF